MSWNIWCIYRVTFIKLETFCLPAHIWDKDSWTGRFQCLHTLCSLLGQGPVSLKFHTQPDAIGAIIITLLIEVKLLKTSGLIKWQSQDSSP